MENRKTMASTSKNSPSTFERCIAILSHLHLLKAQNNKRLKIEKMTVADFLEAGKAEPRIFEVLPAAIHHYPQYFKGTTPPEILEMIEGKSKKRKFHGIPIQKCLFWLKYPRPEDYYEAW